MQTERQALGEQEHDGGSNYFEIQVDAPLRYTRISVATNTVYVRYYHQNIIVFESKVEFKYCCAFRCGPNGGGGGDDYLRE